MPNHNKVWSDIRLESKEYLLVTWYSANRTITQYQSRKFTIYYLLTFLHLSNAEIP